MGQCCAPKVKQQPQNDEQYTKVQPKQQEKQETINTPQQQTVQEEVTQQPTGKYIQKQDVLNAMNQIQPCFQQLIYNLLDPKNKGKISSDLYEQLKLAIHNEQELNQEINTMSIICEVLFMMNKQVDHSVLDNLFKLDQQTLPKELQNKSFQNLPNDKEQLIELLQDYIMEFQIY